MHSRAFCAVELPLLQNSVKTVILAYLPFFCKFVAAPGHCSTLAVERTLPAVQHPLVLNCLRKQQQRLSAQSLIYPSDVGCSGPGKLANTPLPPAEYATML